MICYKNRKMNAGVVAVYFSLFIAICEANQEAKLRFYHDSFENFTELFIHEAQQILSTSWYKPDRNTMIFCHGYTGIPTGPAVTEIIKTYLEQGKSNVALLNWEHLAASSMQGFGGSYINWAVPNARQLGVRLVDTFVKLSEAGLDLNGTHLIGHSLGAHIWGITGNNMLVKGIRMPRITGLDPAGLGFEKKSPLQKLSPLSAAFVDIIHTDPNKYGMRSSSGTVDFWPNYRAIGPVRQPGCPSHVVSVFSQDDLCSHNRSWKLLIDSIKYPGTIKASYARNHKIWKNYSKEDRNAITLNLGDYNDNLQPGNYYFVTNAQSPFGLGLDGL